jgi:EAL domain-containing protein (putative c-di-GMP-specific phosphodiesterase class I)
MQENSARNLELINALHHALERNELYLVYQPLVSLETNCIIGAEALLRWSHPKLGDILPDEFIPLAEESGLILSIGEWVIRTAVQEAKSWIEYGLPPMIVAVNLSAVQFRHQRLPDIVTEILDDIGLPPEYLEIELTEAVTMKDPISAYTVMDNLYERGIHMSIDDFGTGYSSLNYLKKFKVYKLKIDQSFIRDINSDPDDKAIVNAIISMAHSL